jgi:uridine kinase
MSAVTLVGIAGGTCSGKTLVAKRLIEFVGGEHVIMIKQDSYYRDLKDYSPEERSKINFDHPEAFDTELLFEHLNDLLNGKSVEEPIYSYINHSRTGETNTLEPKRIIVLEGILALDDARLRDLMDFKVFVSEEADIRLARRLKRDENERGRSSQSVLLQYLESVRPMHLQFIEPSKRYADIIIPRGGRNTPAIQILANHITALINS